jgi:hypothetical protein
MRRAERRQADEPPATIEEISEAIAALTKGDLIRLNGKRQAVDSANSSEIALNYA